ncbi:hypothetical protein BDZ89DRAFT_133406 [Hymenopellis radicata]|nr:hypothetical protein BDZ89DRAFT_133406 [Hymenopellis radicata]
MAKKVSQLSKENEAPRSKRAATSSSSKTSNHQEEQQPAKKKQKTNASDIQEERGRGTTNLKPDLVVYYPQPAVPGDLRMRNPVFCSCPLCIKHVKAREYDGLLGLWVDERKARKHSKECPPSQNPPAHAAAVPIAPRPSISEDRLPEIRRGVIERITASLIGTENFDSALLVDPDSMEMVLDDKEAYETICKHECERFNQGYDRDYWFSRKGDMAQAGYLQAIEDVKLKGYKQPPPASRQRETLSSEQSDAVRDAVLYLIVSKNTASHLRECANDYLLDGFSSLMVAQADKLDVEQTAFSTALDEVFKAADQAVTAKRLIALPPISNCILHKDVTPEDLEPWLGPQANDGGDKDVKVEKRSGRPFVLRIKRHCLVPRDAEPIPPPPGVPTASSAPRGRSRERYPEEKKRFEHKLKDVAPGNAATDYCSDTARKLRDGDEKLITDINTVFRLMAFSSSEGPNLPDKGRSFSRGLFQRNTWFMETLGIGQKALFSIDSFDSLLNELRLVCALGALEEPGPWTLAVSRCIGRFAQSLDPTDPSLALMQKVLGSLETLCVGIISGGACAIGLKMPRYSKFPTENWVRYLDILPLCNDKACQRILHINDAGKGVKSKENREYDRRPSVVCRFHRGRTHVMKLFQRVTGGKALLPCPQGLFELGWSSSLAQLFCAIGTMSHWLCKVSGCKSTFGAATLMYWGNVEDLVDEDEEDEEDEEDDD